MIKIREEIWIGERPSPERDRDQRETMTREIQRPKRD